MINKEYIDRVLYELRVELEHQNQFIEKLRSFNNELEAKASQPLYSVQQLIATWEQNASAIRRAMAQLPLEEEVN